MHTAATLFSGGGGADIGLDEAGLNVKWGLEHDEEIAQVARDNGLNIHTADVTEVDPSWYERVDVLHASPPCPNFSVAKTGGEETDEDVSLAEATVRFADEIEPELFTLENVWGYRKSRSWKLIREHLQRNGYDWNAWKINAANYGVPQTRKRMIVAARKGGPRPKKPPATHAENPSSGRLFEGNLNEWVGWYEAIEDLIPDLPETELADWQKERLPDELIETTIVDTQPNARGDCRQQQQPTKTVAADPAGGAPRAVLVNTNWSGENRSKVCRREETDPAFAGTVSDGGRLRAVLVHGQQTNPAPSGKREDRTAITKEDEEPTFTINVTAHKGTGRAILVNATSNMQVADEDHPAYGQVARERSFQQRAVMGRRVVQMTPRALARFQTFPDWYDLPDSKSLACRIIGNAVPPMLIQKCLPHWRTKNT
jgi:DNA (cytosine-5)-methyltransferase 1